MRVAILSFYSGHLERGVENWTRQLATRLARRVEMTVFQNGPAAGEMSYPVVVAGLAVDWQQRDSRGSLARLFFLDYWSRLIARFTWKLWPQLRQGGFDVVIPTNGGWQAALVRLLTWQRGGKMVVVGHSGRGWDERIGLWTGPDVFVALSQPARQWAKWVNPWVRSVIIPNGVDRRVFSPRGPKAKLPFTDPVVLAVGALERGKRLDLVIRAVAKLAQASLVILGQGGEEQRLRRLGATLLPGRFWLTSVAFAQLPAYYRAADVFTLPAWEHEAFGLVFLEAMACGLPVVATADEIRREIIGSGGLVVDPIQIDSYAATLQRALSISWGQRPQEQAAKFSWDKIALRYYQLLISVCSR